MDAFLVQQLILRQFSESVQEDILSDHKFLQDNDIQLDREILFYELDIGFRKLILFNAIREVSLDNNDIKLVDLNNANWQLKFLKVDSEERLILTKENTKAELPQHFLLISLVDEIRINAFNEIMKKSFIPKKSYEQWYQVILERPLSDNELSIFQLDYDNSPSVIERNISEQIQQGKSTIDTLVPKSKTYYEYLVGEYDQSSSIIDYMHNQVNKHIDNLLSWNSYDGFLFSLFLSSHSSITSTEIAQKLDTKTLIKAYKWLHNYGDMISQIGAIGVGLSILDEKPELEIYIIKMIKLLLAYDPKNEKNNRFRLLSALIILVDGELSQSKVFDDTPPFWRRLASIAHASLLERCFIKLNVDFKDFIKKVESMYSDWFSLQTFCDLRLEPRWQPGYISEEQLKFEFVGRMIIDADKYKSKIYSEDMKTLLFESHSKSLPSYIEYPYAFLPGPLEGSINFQLKVPDEILKLVEDNLNSDEIELSSFIVLVNSALIYKLDTYHAQLAAEALRKIKYQLRDIKDHHELFNFLNGLATAASVTRSQELALELKVIVRKYRFSKGEYQLTADEFFWLGMISASAFENMSEWCEYIGDWVTNLAFQTLKEEETKRIHSHLLKLCHIVPELWHKLGISEAAMKSLST